MSDETTRSTQSIQATPTANDENRVIMSYEDITSILDIYKLMFHVIKQWTWNLLNTQTTRTLVGGDQPSTAQARGCMMIQNNKINLVPVCKDWHTEVCLMEVLLIMHGFLIQHIGSL